MMCNHIGLVWDQVEVCDQDRLSPSCSAAKTRNRANVCVCAYVRACVRVKLGQTKKLSLVQ